MFIKVKCKKCGTENIGIYPGLDKLIIICDECFERPEYTIKVQVRQERIPARANEEKESSFEAKEGSTRNAEIIKQKRKQS